MKKLAGIIIVLILSTIIFKCSKVINPEESFIYPLKTGNSWEYTRSLASFNFRPDTFDISPSEYYSEIDVEITRKDDLIIVGENSLDTIEAFCFYEHVVEQDSAILESETYYKNNEDGLYCYTWDNAPLAVPKAHNCGRYYFNDRYFNNIHEISQFITQELYHPFAAADTIFCDETVRKVLHYPINTSTQWCFLEPDISPGWRIDKIFVDWEIVVVSAGTFNCIKVQRLYDFDNDSKWDDNIVFFDYFHSSGLIKRSMLLKDIIRYSEFGDTLGFFDALEESILTGYHLE